MLHGDSGMTTRALTLLTALAGAVSAGAIGSLACANSSIDTGGPGGIRSGQGGGAVDPPTRDTVGATADGGVGRTICGADGGAMANSMPIPPGARGAFLPQLPATVKQQTTPVPPLIGGTLLALSDGQTAVAADPERDQVYVVDLLTNTVRATLALQAGDEPGRLVEDATGLVHVALRRGGAIVSLDPKNGMLGARRAVCSAPRGIAFEPASALLHVACAGGELVSLPAAGGAATRTLTLERDLRDVVVGAGENLLVSTFRGAKVLVVGKDGTLSTALHPGSGLAPSALGMPRHMSPAVAWRMQPLGDSKGSVVMLHQTGVDDIIDPAAGGYGGLKGCGGIATPGVSVLTPGSPSPPVAGGMQMVSLAIDIAVSPGGSQVALAVPGNAHTQGLASIVEGPISTVTNGAGGGCAGIGQPQGAQPPMGEVIAVTYTKTSLLLGQTREPAALWRGDTGVTIPLATGSREDTGQMLFHVNAGGGVACASCHPEG
ncbi:MAG: cytochrome c peroxidase, partial [Myxococcales bacterium]|nr:cytochrome c peroxidase [Myxococcales bacterium]